MSESISAIEENDDFATPIKRTGINANVLKLIAIIAMTIDHLAWVGIATYSQAETPIQISLHSIGRLTAPIMIFFVAEGYHPWPGSCW